MTMRRIYLTMAIFVYDYILKHHRRLRRNIKQKLINKRNACVERLCQLIINNKANCF